MWSDPSRRNQNFQIRYAVSEGWGDPIQVNRRPTSKMAFSDYEKKEIKESIGFLTVAFALALSGGLYTVMNDYSILLRTLPMAFAAVMTGFLLHEIAHKWMAQQYGCWAEYRGNKRGLYFALAMSAFLGVLLAAPGAVMVSGRITDRQNGIIAAVGPITNIVIALVVLPVYILTNSMEGQITTINELARFIVLINLILAGFNMIPIQPLDGSKVIAWNKGAYFGIILAVLAIFYLSPVDII
ncbi:MAG: metalloprotease [Methanobacteriota archaeon]|uniref:Site-2 protease family protein n=1 Tax=Marine Group III euryarchaeote TaxID=2173149 RepID=A0A7J4GT53_9ARCH|nr:MAG: metalloprotease [Euryarchaeota archaeon]HIF37179.1 site-2 protease family protein [Marine Group III euryarchaeote]